MRSSSSRIAIVVHGGAGNSVENEDGCAAAAAQSLARLRGRAEALEAAVAAVTLMEDDPRFNAGTGSILRSDGNTIEADAAVMDSTGRLGAVSCVQRVRNPVQLARMVVDTPHWMLCGAGAEAFARARGVADFDLAAATRAARRSAPACDTVGAVALDRDGRFAVALSTGGSAPALPGRVGDTPIPGCGFWTGAHGAVAATGVGEEIVARLLARTVYGWVEEGCPLQQALERGVALFPDDIDVGLIALTRTHSGVASNRAMPAHRLEADV